MQARDVMVRGVISVGPDIPVQIAANAMVRNCVSALPVINIYAKLVGIGSVGSIISTPHHTRQKGSPRAVTDMVTGRFSCGYLCEGC